MKNFLKYVSSRLSAFATAADLTEAEATVLQADVQEQMEEQAAARTHGTEVITTTAPVQPQAMRRGGVASMILDAETQKVGSAIRGFVPVFLRETFSVSDDVHVYATRGKEQLVFTNPTMDKLGELNTVGYKVTVQMSEFDTCKALCFIVGARELEDYEYPLYPSMIVELGDTDELMVVYRLKEAIDRKVHGNLWRVQGLLQEVIGQRIHGDIVRGEVPMPGFFFKGKRPVRVLRYGSEVSLGELIHAYNADSFIQERIKANPVREVVESETEQLIDPKTEMNRIVAEVGVAISGPITLFESPLAFSKIVGLKLREVGVDDESRLSLAPELLTILSALEAEWIEQSKVTEEGVAEVLKNPDALTPAPKKSRQKARKPKVSQAS